MCCLLFCSVSCLPLLVVEAKGNKICMHVPLMSWGLGRLETWCARRSPLLVARYSSCFFFTTTVTLSKCWNLALASCKWVPPELTACLGSTITVWLLCAHAHLRATDVWWHTSVMAQNVTHTTAANSNTLHLKQGSNFGELVIIHGGKSLQTQGQMRSSARVGLLLVCLCVCAVFMPWCFIGCS